MATHAKSGKLLEELAETEEASKIGDYLRTYKTSKGELLKDTKSASTRTKPSLSNSSENDLNFLSARISKLESQLKNKSLSDEIREPLEKKVTVEKHRVAVARHFVLGAEVAKITDPKTKKNYQEASKLQLEEAEAISKQALKEAASRARTEDVAPKTNNFFERVTNWVKSFNFFGSSKTTLDSLQAEQKAPAELKSQQKLSTQGTAIRKELEKKNKSVATSWINRAKKKAGISTTITQR